MFTSWELKLLCKKVNSIAEEIHRINEEKGFNILEGYNPPYDIPVRLLLIVEEVIEGFKPFRDGKEKTELPEELADIIIRTLHIARLYNINIGETLFKKIEHNKHRPFKHGHKRF